MVKPLFCKSYEIDGKTTEINAPVMLEQGMNRETARYIQRALRRVVTEGTAKSINNTTYGIAGKTGTAKIDATGYSPNDAYFVGFFPADNPKYTCLVMIHGTMASGGAAAAPVVKRMADGVMALDKELGNIKMESLAWETPESSRVPVNPKSYRADLASFYSTLDMPFALADSNYRWVTYNEGYHNYSPRTDIMPNCKGMTAKDAIRLLSELGMKVKFSGYGRVTAQEPKPHSAIRKNGTAILTLSN
jgi:cell division protein FtsI (penicillin-binding protein 3)